MPVTPWNAPCQPTPVIGRFPFGPTYGKISAYRKSWGTALTVRPKPELVAAPPPLVTMTEYTAAASFALTLKIVSVLLVVPEYLLFSGNVTPLVCQMYRSGGVPAARTRNEAPPPA